MNNKFNIPVHIDNFSIRHGNYIDIFYNPITSLRSIKRRVISNRIDVITLFGIELSIKKNNQ